MIQNKILSICVITYNQENYIQKTLQTIFEQKVNFPIEIIISNDCSSDNTHFRIEEELKNCPDGFTVKYFNHKKNLGMMPNFIFTLRQATGKYIAICEGDDYWIDPLKLQKQADILNSNSNYSLCFTNAKVLNDDFITVNDKVSNVENKVYKDSDLFNQWLIPTASTLFINSFTEEDFQILSHPDILFGDIILFLVLANKGNLVGMKDYTAVYRINSESFTNREKTIIYYEKIFKHLVYLSLIFDGKYKPFVISHINKQGYKLFRYYVSKYDLKSIRYLKFFLLRFTSK